MKKRIISILTIFLMISCLGCLEDENVEELVEEKIVIKENVSEETEDMLTVYQRNGTIDTSLIMFYEGMPLLEYMNMSVNYPLATTWEEMLADSSSFGTIYYSCETPDAWVKVVNGTIISLHKELPKDL